MTLIITDLRLKLVFDGLTISCARICPLFDEQSD